MINNILPVLQCRENMYAIQQRLTAELPQEANALMEQLRDLASLLATSAQTVASLQFHLSDARLNAVRLAKEQKYSPAMAKVYIEGLTAEIGAEYKLSERQNSCIVHSIDAARSILSYTKQENFASNLQR
jgi:hypothetical protein